MGMVQKLVFVLILISMAFTFVFVFKPLLFPQSLIPQITPTALPSPLPRPSSITLMAVGDIMLGRSVNFQMIKKGNWRYPFLKTATLLSSADLAFGNLESPFFSPCPTTQTGMVFCARPEAVAGLTEAGFDVLSIANNHILNQGKTGREQTIELLINNQILPSDSQKLVVKQLNQEIIGFLSFDLTANNNPAPILKIIKESAPQVDILIVSLHWGAEYQKEPAIWQKELAHQIIEAGAKVIIGHHPHVIQPTEKYQDGLIFYSLGNFVFDQDWSQQTKEGEIAKIVFEGKRVKSFEKIPVYIKDSQPQLAE